MPYRRFISSAKITIFFLGLLLLPMPAFAGFQWVAPDASPGPPPAIIAPPSAMSPPPMMAPVTSETLPQAATEAPAPLAPIIVTGNPSAPSQNVPGDTVKGFAKQVPIAVALRQILPPGYTFSIDPDVDLAVLVSFQGGRPWRDTLRDALEPAGLIMRENGQMVSIGHVDGTVVPAKVATVTTTTVTQPVVTGIPGTVPVAVVSPASGMMPIVERWKAERGDSLRKVLEDWTKRAGVELNWHAEYDYPVQASVNFSGNFEDAVRNLLVGFADAHPQPIAELHSNQKIGQNVLVVEARGNNYSN